MAGNYWRAPIVGHVTNFGHVYCACHNVEQPGVLGTRTSRNIPETVDRAIRADDGWDNVPCDWPGCSATLPARGSVPNEYVDMSLQENL